MGNTITQAPHSTRIWMTYQRQSELPEINSLYLPMPRIIAGIPSMGMIQLIQAAVTQATATAVGSNPMLTQAEMAMGANTNREPKLAPVNVALRAGEQCEHQYDDKWADTGTQSAGHRVTHHGR